MSAGTYLYDIDHSLNADDITLFYRVGKDQKTVKNIKWSTAQMVRGKSGDFTIEADGSVQFMVVYAPNMPYSEIGELNLSKK